MWNKPTIVAERRIKRSRKKYKDERKKFLSDYKLKHGCSVCGYNKCADALEFDHIDRSQKSFGLNAAPSYSWEKVLAEIEKCVLLCANCHREKTAKEKDYMSIDFEEPEELQLSLL